MKSFAVTLALAASSVVASPFRQNFAPLARQFEIPPVDIPAVLEQLPDVITSLKCSNSTAFLAARSPQLDIPAILDHLPEVIDAFDCAEKRTAIAARSPHLDIGAVLGDLPDVFDALQGSNVTITILPRKPKPQLDVAAILEAIPGLLDALAEHGLPVPTILPFPLNSTLSTPDLPTILQALPGVASSFQRRHQSKK